MATRASSSIAPQLQAHAPNVTFHILDGNDRDLLGSLWAAGDIFVSLVDNIQETFGITPLEAMAAGLPVVASDWDGYRYTLREGQEAFLVPTLGGPPAALPHEFTASHGLGLTSYQSYVGVIAQHTAVHIGRATEALVRLIENPELRRKMGEAGRSRIRNTFDWTVVAPQYASLVTELNAIRQASSPDLGAPSRHPIKGRSVQGLCGLRQLHPGGQHRSSPS